MDRKSKNVGPAGAGPTSERSQDSRDLTRKLAMISKMPMMISQTPITHVMASSDIPGPTSTITPPIRRMMPKKMFQPRPSFCSNPVNSAAKPRKMKAIATNMARISTALMALAMAKTPRTMEMIPVMIVKARIPPVRP